MRGGRWLIGLAATPLALAGIYGIAGYGLGAWPDGAPTADGPVTLAIIANPFHSDLLMPAADWRSVLDLPADVRSVAIGWGDRAFYLETPTIADLRLSTVLTALGGADEAVMHVGWYWLPLGGPEVHVLRVTEDQKDRLEAYLRNAFVEGADGRPTRLDHAGYGEDDAFYRAQGHWTPIVTCNEFLAQGLRQAGIRAGVWSPFTNGIVTHLPTA
ncbi:MAG TPA: TIGR02117 family protein [Aliidongia sp.]|nr:TIGR02117 family protein [Aliidongia sp.]